MRFSSCCGWKLLAGRATTGRLRIIGGQWRSRRLAFPDAPGLRPTADRVRETLFNWLQADVPGAACLDLFAGSGACGLEALSRGAASVVFVERSRPVADAIRNNLQLLGAERATVVNADAMAWMQQQTGRADVPGFDLVFMDPPYESVMLPESCRQLAQSGMLESGAKIYLEDRSELNEEQLPPNWQVIKRSKAGAVHFYLCQMMSSP